MIRTGTNALSCETGELRARLPVHSDFPLWHVMPNFGWNSFFSVCTPYGDKYTRTHARTHAHIHTHTHTHTHLSQCQEEKATGMGNDASIEQLWRQTWSWNDQVSSGESSIEQRPDTRICIVQRISDGMKECEGDRSQRDSEAVKKESTTSGGQTGDGFTARHSCHRTLHYCVSISEVQ